MALLLKAGVYLLTRARGYQILEHPQIQGVFAHPPAARVTRVNSDEEVELFDGGWLPFDEGLAPTRIIVARHRIPTSGKKVSVGKCVGEWVYELFIPNLPTEGFLVEDVLDLYHGRGAFETVLADEDLEEDPDRWCSYDVPQKHSTAILILRSLAKQHERWFQAFLTASVLARREQVNRVKSEQHNHSPFEKPLHI
jgi:hypothetical protein